MGLTAFSGSNHIVSIVTYGEARFSDLRIRVGGWGGGEGWLESFLHVRKIESTVLESCQVDSSFRHRVTAVWETKYITDLRNGASNYPFGR